MMKTYSEFINVVNSKVALYDQIPEEHLSVEGKNVYNLYKTVQFNACFASNATELLALLNDEDIEAAGQYAGSELRQIHRCLERLADLETAPAT